MAIKLARAGSPQSFANFRSNVLGSFSGLRGHIWEMADDLQVGTEHAAPADNSRLRLLSDANRQLGTFWAGVNYVQVNHPWDLSGDKIRRLAGQRSIDCLGIISAGGDRIEEDLEAFFAVCGMADYWPQSGLLERVRSVGWWVGAYSRECRRRSEQILRSIGYVSKNSGVYLSEYTFEGWVESQRRAAAMMEDAELVDAETGEVLPMADAVGSGVADLENRRAELMTRISGCEKIAESRGLIPLFLTLTCPSKFHLFAGGRDNPKYDGATPRDAADYLNRVWARIRAALGRAEIDLYGLRIAEPHHDGCPHWHLLLFVDPVQKIDLLEIVQGYSLEMDGGERGAEQRRVEIVELSGAGGAAGYVAKYVSKNVDGFGVGDDFEAPGQLAKNTALRVRAWASVWGIRQFQFLGDPSVTVWRELRRVAGDGSRAAAVSGVAAVAMAAADVGDWAAFVQVMGGPCLARVDRPIAPHYSEFKQVSQVKRVGVFGDVLRAVIGVSSAGVVIVSRWREWVLSFKRASAPWSRVNNCISEIGQSSYSVVMQC